MKLKSITLNNFKGMDNIEFSLDQKTTVIFGINGVGKSTILKAIDLLYANIIAKLTKKKTTEFDKDDISYGKSKATIEAKFVFEDGEEKEYSRSFDRANGRNNNPNQLKELVEKISYGMGSDEEVSEWIQKIMDSVPNRNVVEAIMSGPNASIEEILDKLYTSNVIRL